MRGTSANRCIRIVAIIACIVWGLFGTAGAQVQVFTDENAYVAALGGLEYSPLFEDFDGSDWDVVRNETAPSVTSKGITWTATDEVTTGQGPAISGWAIYDQPGGDPDILYGASARTLYGIGGWFTTSTPYTSVQIYLDGIAIGDAKITVGSQHSFLGVIDPDGFQNFEIRDTEATPGDQKHWFADNVTFGIIPAAQVPSLSATTIGVLVLSILVTGIMLLGYRIRRRTKTI